MQYTDCCLAASQRVYHTIPASGEGDSGTNYDETDFGYDVMEAQHGPEALNLWKRAERKPDLLVTDMMMPEGMSGRELAKQLRDGAPDLKVLYTSGYSTELFGSDLELGGRSSFLPKPYNPRTLAKVVRDCLDA